MSNEDTRCWCGACADCRAEYGPIMGSREEQDTTPARQRGSILGQLRMDGTVGQNNAEILRALIRVALHSSPMTVDDASALRRMNDLADRLEHEPRGNV